MRTRDKDIQTALVRVVRLTWEIAQAATQDAKLALLDDAESQLRVVRTLIHRETAA